MTAKLSWQKIVLVLGALAIAGLVLIFAGEEAAVIIAIVEGVILTSLEGKK